MRPALVAGLGTAAVAAAAAAAYQGGPGRWLLAVAALALGGEAGRGGLLRPALRVTDDGVDFVPGLRRVHLRWDDLDAASLDRQRRRFVTSTWLEFDTGERLYALPGYRLGAPVAEVAEAVNTRMPAGPR